MVDITDQLLQGPLAAALSLAPQQPQASPFQTAPPMQINPVNPALHPSVQPQPPRPPSSPLAQVSQNPAQPPTPDIDQRIAARQAQEQALTPLIDQLARQQEEGYHGMQRSESALKDLLTSTRDRLGSLQFGPSQQEMGLRASAAMAGPFGLGGELGRAGEVTAQGMQQRRQGDLMREELMAKYGIDAQQADIMAQQFGVQGANARIQPLLQRANMAENAMDRLAQQRGMQEIARNKIDPSLVAELAAARIRGELGAIGNGQGNGQGGGQSDPVSMAYATYQTKMPNPNYRSPASVAMYNAQLQRVLAINPNFQQGNFDLANNSRKNFDIKNGDNIRFLGNVAGHMEQYDQLMQQARAQGLRSDSPALNTLIQAWATQIGRPEIVDLKGVQSFLGPEFAKVIVPSGATGVERKEREENIRSQLGPDQWDSLHGNLKAVLGTQLDGLKHQYDSNLWFMPHQLRDQEWGAKMDRPELQGILEAHQSRTQPTAEDIAFVHANPQTAGAFKQRFGIDPPQ